MKQKTAKGNHYKTYRACDHGRDHDDGGDHDHDHGCDCGDLLFQSRQQSQFYRCPNKSNKEITVQLMNNDEQH